MGKSIDEAQVGKVIQGEKQTRIRWWIEAPLSKDAYECYIVRYEWVGDPDEAKDATCFYLDLHGNWREFPIGGYIESCFELSGVMVNTLAIYKVLDRSEVSESLRDFCTKILASVTRRVEQDREVGSDTPTD